MPSSRRITNKKNNKKKVKQRPASIQKKNAPEPTVNELLEAASAATESLDIDQNNTNNKQQEGRADLIHALEKMGELQVSIGDQDLAKQHFLQSLKLLEEGRKNEQQQGENNSKNISFYETHSNLCFYVGQLSLEKEALEAYQRGIRSLEECIQLVANGEASDDMQDDTDTQKQEGPSSSSVIHDLMKQKLSSAYCNLAELYLTDLCEEETAESDCEQYLEKALQLKASDGEPPVDALQTIASLRLSQQDRQLEAVPFILRSYEKQRVGSEALATLVGLHHGGTKDDNNNKMKEEEEEGQSRELLEVEAANNLPEFEFRCNTAKLLLECAGLLKDSRKKTSSTSGTNQEEDECITAAICVLGSLLAQNDEVVEIWFLTGCAFAGKIPPLVDEAKFYLERAKEMLTDIQKALKEESQYVCDSERQDLEEQLEMNADQMQDVQSKLDELPAELEEVDTTDDKLMMKEG
ncbi:hypothetical protein FRACYDRAFT_275746 [Fragilariopsis cylindrus CCMP1102]|uniref:TPR-like protein n=1 Tax=Fragilariopsis cylindrus CCMP1102 TaxID=635003 RepID=A0A1E7FBY6_9STRA|nr:hypothetical protein FRACYDRAFT_275746 [Fragilariopsis cylindrus CCMP1102]|eukprot:OEU15659.1 hypothetical protein FRACYDRAFT_275746 [Fragilariopsis cylindrus CCMP1102]